MGIYYLLNDDKTYRECSRDEFLERYNNKVIRVGNNKINGYEVSTVWLGINHGYRDGLPLLFETRIFSDTDKSFDYYQERYSTWQEAEEGHARAIQYALYGKRTSRSHEAESD